MKHHHKFLIGIRSSTKIAKRHLDQIRGDAFITWQNYHDDLGVYVMSFTEEWDYYEDKPRLGTSIQEELASGNRRPEHEKMYSKYFEWTEGSSPPPSRSLTRRWSAA